MNRHRASKPVYRHQTAYGRLAQRIDEAAEREGRYSNTELIRRLREHMFADVDALAKSGRVKLPE